MREVRDWWNATGEYFQAEADIPPGVGFGPGCPDDDDLGLLADVDGADVVELGCGGAQCAVGLVERGAASVVGVDLSETQLAFADRLLEEEGVAGSVDILAGDVTALPLAAGSVDLAVSAYALQWVADLEACFAEAARVLRPDGALVCSLPHPFYGCFDPETGELERSYFETGAVRSEHEGIDPDQVLQRRRLADVHAALRAAGFVVDRLREPGSTDPGTYEARWNSRPALMAKVPRTLVFRATLEAER